MKFEREWAKLKKHGHYGYFFFNGTANDWRPTVNKHFCTANLPQPTYGVYVVRQKTTNDVIYIGKSGTMKQNGTYRDQDFQKRLLNREKNQPRKIIFGQRVLQYGEILLEYVVLNPSHLIPGYVESRLLQAFFREYGHLPPDNASL